MSLGSILAALMTCCMCEDAQRPPSGAEGFGLDTVVARAPWRRLFRHSPILQAQRSEASAESAFAARCAFGHDAEMKQWNWRIVSKSQPHWLRSRPQDSSKLQTSAAGVVERAPLKKNRVPVLSGTFCAIGSYPERTAKHAHQRTLLAALPALQVHSQLASSADHSAGSM
jgi:hypothetical protein